MKVLKLGSSGQSVKAWQNFLIGQGFDPGVADGKFGERTKAATISFQQRHGLVADGVVGKLVPETVQFSRKWRIMCADDERVVGLMYGGGMGKNGHEYLQTYCQIMTIRHGIIVEMHELFDTALVELVLNDNPTAKGPSEVQQKFDF